MKQLEAFLEAVERNGPDRTYVCQSPEFGFAYEHTVFPDDLFNDDNLRRARHWDSFDVVDAGGAAWILYRGTVAFRPRPDYAGPKPIGVLKPIITMRFDPQDLLHQVTAVSRQFGVRLVAGRLRTSSWRAHFVDHAGDPGRDIYLDRCLGKLPGETLEEAVWAAVRDIRAVRPWRRTPA